MPDADTTLTAVYLETGSVVAAISSEEPFGVTSSQVFAPGLAINAFNGVGLTGDLHGDTFPLGWMADGTVEKKWIKVDLGGEYQLTSLDVWNGNLANQTEISIQQADVFYSLTDPAENDPTKNLANANAPFDATGWLPLLVDQQFAISTGAVDAPQTDHILLDGSKARYLAIQVDTNYNDSTTGSVALAEVKINGVFVPTPRTLDFDSNVTVTGAFTGGGTQGSETMFSIAAPAAPAGFEFHGWSGAHVNAFVDASGSNNHLHDARCRHDVDGSLLGDRQCRSNDFLGRAFWQRPAPRCLRQA